MRTEGAVFGHTVRSNVPLRWIDDPADAPPPIGPSITVEAVERVDVQVPPPFRDLTCSIARLDDGALGARTTDAGRFRMDSQVSTVSAELGSAGPDAWEHRLLTWVIPHLLADRGHVVLHGAAMATDAGAVILVGPSGRGKSTLAAAAAANGLRLLSEDGVLLSSGPDGVLAYSGPAGIRLWPASGGPKETFDEVTGSRHHGRIPVAAILGLRERTDRPAPVARLDAAASMAVLYGNAFSPPGQMAQQFTALSAVLRGVAVLEGGVRDDATVVSDELARVLAEVAALLR